MQHQGKGKILCVGLTCIDLVNFVSTYPAEDTDNRTWTLGGNAANNVTVLKQLGVSADVFCAISHDNPILPSELFVERPHGMLPMSIVIISENTGSRTIFHHRGEHEEPTLAEFIERIPNVFDYSWIHFDGRNFDDTREMMHRVRQERKDRRLPRISVEIEKVRPAPILEQLIPLADVVCVSKDFARSRGFQDSRSAVEGIYKQWARTDAMVICAWGELGAAGRDPESGQIFMCPAFSYGPVVDTLGAGDCFMAGLLHALDGGESLKDSLEAACKLAGKKVTQHGLLNLVNKDQNNDRS